MIFRRLFPPTCAHPIERMETRTRADSACAWSIDHCWRSRARRPRSGRFTSQTQQVQTPALAARAAVRIQPSPLNSASVRAAYRTKTDQAPGRLVLAGACTWSTVPEPASGQAWPSNGRPSQVKKLKTCAHKNETSQTVPANHFAEIERPHPLPPSCGASSWQPGSTEGRTEEEEKELSLLSSLCLFPVFPVRSRFVPAPSPPSQSAEDPHGCWVSALLPAPVPGVPGCLCVPRPFLFARSAPRTATARRASSFLASFTAANAARKGYRHRHPWHGEAVGLADTGQACTLRPRASQGRSPEGKLEGQRPAQGRAMRAGQGGAYWLALRAGMATTAASLRNRSK